MWRDVPNSIDRFPGDFVASLRAGGSTALVLGGAAWWLARQYMMRTYPGHGEMLGAAIIVGVLDGAMLGIAAFVLTYVLRVWRYERRMRRRSDAALQRELAEIAADASGTLDSPRDRHERDTERGWYSDPYDESD